MNQCNSLRIILVLFQIRLSPEGLKPKNFTLSPGQYRWQLYELIVSRHRLSVHFKRFLRKHFIQNNESITENSLTI